MKRVALVAVLAVAVLALWKTRGSSSSSSSPSSAMPPPPPPSPAGHARIDKVTRLSSPAERAALAERIRAARAQPAAGAAATSARPVPRLPASDEPALSKTEIRTAMREVIPALAECYEAALPSLPSPNINVTAALTLTGDPDIGTIVDAHALADDNGQPLPAKLDDCLRSTFQLIALPPLAEGDTIEVNYPFVFRNDGP